MIRPDRGRASSLMVVRSDNVASAEGTSTLPIMPAVTPALGFAGAVLIISGIIYTLYGIRNRMLQIYMSVAYLISLSVTVLIMYMIDPPISNAEQGGYFVAAVATGLIAAAVALIFKEITEGLACLLGGFCISMWFMALRPGGLIHSKIGSTIFIVLLTVTAFACSFIKYIRNYAIITCSSFSGATAIVLGIDCFTRAGLKEFWVYIWALNDLLFPLDIATYPLTKGICVEIAAIVALSACGLLWQLKLWKIIKHRRQTKAAELTEQEKVREESEAEAGRHVEEIGTQERARWEETYGDNLVPNLHHQSYRWESSLSSKRCSFDNGDEILTYRNPRDDQKDEKPDMVAEQTLDEYDKLQRLPSVLVRKASEDSVEQARCDTRLSHSNGDEEEKAHQTSLTAGQPCLVQPCSTNSPPVGVFPYHYAAVVSCDGDDEVRSVCSSIAPMVDGLPDPSRDALMREPASPWASRTDLLIQNPASGPCDDGQELCRVDDIEEKSIAGDKSECSSTPAPRSHLVSELDDILDSYLQESTEENMITHAGSLPNLQDYVLGTDASKGLQSRLSKAVIGHRTHEWMKHLDGAEKPNFEDDDILQRPGSPGIQVRLIIPDLVDQAGRLITESQHDRHNSNREDLDDSLPKPYNPSIRSKQSDSNSTSTSSLRRSNAIRKNTMSLRKPAGESLVKQRYASAPSILETTLLDQRQAILASKYRSPPLQQLTSEVLNAYRSTTCEDNTAAPLLTETDKISSPSRRQRLEVSRKSPDDMTLSERRALLQQTRHPTSPSSSGPRNPPSPTPLSAPLPTMAEQLAILPRMHTGPRKSSTSGVDHASRQLHLLHQWRHTLAAESAPQTMDGTRRDAMLAEKRAASERECAREAEQKRRKEGMDMAWRLGRMGISMDEAHRKGIRRMQKRVVFKTAEGRSVV